MGADKNSSPKRELGLYPKFTTKDLHTSLPRSRSHYRPTNPKKKPQTIPKRKHETRSKGLSNPMQCQADGPQTWGGQPGGTGPTVRYPWADGPYLIHGWSASNWCHADSPRRPGGRSDIHLPAKNSWPTGSKHWRSKTRDEHEEP
jgi:hypothetical protein